MNDVFHAALEREGSAQAAFVTGACALLLSPVEEARADGIAVSTRAGVVVQILRERASRPREHRHHEGEGGGAVPEAERGALD